LEFTIAERKYSFRCDYDIEAAGGQYFAQKAAFSFHDKITLQDKSGNSIARGKGLFSFLRCKHDFRFFDGRVYRSWLSRFFLPVYACEGSNESYLLYVHRKLRYSIFRNDVQVAAAKKIALFTAMEASTGSALTGTLIWSY